MHRFFLGPTETSPEHHWNTTGTPPEHRCHAGGTMIGTLEHWSKQYRNTIGTFTCQTLRITNWKTTNLSHSASSENFVDDNGTTQRRSPSPIEVLRWGQSWSIWGGCQNESSMIGLVESQPCGVIVGKLTSSVDYNVIVEYSCHICSYI